MTLTFDLLDKKKLNQICPYIPIYLFDLERGIGVSKHPVLVNHVIEHGAYQSLP